MRNRFFSFLLTCSLVLTLLLIPVGAVDGSADQGSCGEHLSWQLAPNGTLTISGSGAMYDYEEGSPWIDASPAVTSVVIQSGCTGIGIGAFAGCVDLKSITIPASVTAIRGTAFAYCQSLERVTIPAGVAEIEGYTFWNCSGLTGVTISDGVGAIGEYAFSDCDSLTGVTIPGSVTTIGDYAFSDCGALAELKLNNGTTKIGEWAFVDCNQLTSVVFPSSMKEIADFAFLNCSSLENVTFSGGLTSIGEWAFSGCGMKSLELPDSVRSIGLASFQDCLKLTEAKLSAGLSVISSQAFCGCSNLNSVEIPDSVTTVAGNAFSDCSRLKDVYYSGTRSQWNAVTIETGNQPLLKASIHCVSVPLTITQQPVDYTGAVNSTATFTVSAAGDGLSYQWQVSTNGGRTWSKSSVTSARYAAKLTAEKDGRMVRCVVTDSEGSSVTSAAATMRIQSVVITQQPVDYTGVVNSQAVFNVAATGDGLRYQWEVSTNGGRTWSKSSVTQARYSAKLTAEKNNRMVRCIVTDQYGNSVTSSAATMHIQTLSITTQPVDYTGTVNSTARFTVAAVGEGLTYQWEVSTNGGKTWSKSSVTSANYAAKLTAEKNNRMVRCIVTDKNGNSVTSEPATMHIAKQLAITQHPVDYKGALNSQARFTVAAVGEGLTYQWQVSTNGGRTWSQSSVKSAVYAAKLTAEKDGRMVRCIITDANNNSVTSKPAAMHIG